MEAYTDWHGQMNLPYETALQFAQAFAGGLRVLGANRQQSPLSGLHHSPRVADVPGPKDLDIVRLQRDVERVAVEPVNVPARYAGLRTPPARRSWRLSRRPPSRAGCVGRPRGSTPGNILSL
jgi:hypothetical protein